MTGMCGNAAILCVSEPFERNNVARAVHEKAKFDAIRAQFAEVQANRTVVPLIQCGPHMSSF